ncbi:MAG: DUF4115 domain-containing protein [Rhodospirillales bacterium]|nr:DUF4115 domain-containing protein [Rhodospirillales bacterium]
MSNADTPSTIDETAAEQAQQAVGQLLRETRKKAGLEIAEVARALRIGQRYLEALEDGRNKELPGSTYAIGFVRSYSEYLKLDGEEIVRRYKAEAQSAGYKNTLVFPKPIPDSGVPGAAVLGLGVIVAAIAYGVWYWNSNADDVAAVRVDPVPEQMAAPAASQDGAPQPQDETATAAAEPGSESVNEVAGNEVAGNEAAGDAQSATEAAAQPSGDAPEAFDPPAADQPAEDSPATASPAPISPAAEPTVAAAPAEQAVQPITNTEPAPAATAPTAPAPQVSTPAAAPAATPAPAPAPSGEDGASRITVRATANSWIQIRDEALDRLLFTRLLREGDIYEVPNRAGLSLMTGNAGALELVVDGEAIPTIGKVGEVRRNVELDPEKLKAGTAVTE